MQYTKSGDPLARSLRLAFLPTDFYHASLAAHAAGTTKFFSITFAFSVGLFLVRVKYEFFVSRKSSCRLCHPDDTSGPIEHGKRLYNHS